MGHVLQRHNPKIYINIYLSRWGDCSKGKRFGAPNHLVPIVLMQLLKSWGFISKHILVCAIHMLQNGAMMTPRRNELPAYPWCLLKYFINREDMRSVWMNGNNFGKDKKKEHGHNRCCKVSSMAIYKSTIKNLDSEIFLPLKDSWCEPPMKK